MRASASRVVLHLDVDSFYCGVELKDDPSLAGKPLAVTQGNSGGFVALSAEAKAFGLRKGDGVGARGRAQIDSLIRMNSMGLAECRRRCPGLIIKPMRVDRYREAGQAVLSVLETFGAPVEKTSYDDFYIEATSLVQADSDASKLAEVRVWSGDGSSGDGGGGGGGVGQGKSHVLGTTLPIDLRRGYELAERMRVALRASVGLSASVGIGRSKLVARMLSPQAKPDGALVVREDDVPRLMASCRVQSFPGLQAKRGHAMCAALTTALEAAAPDAISAPSWAVSQAPSRAVSRAPSWAPGQVTLGQALALPEAALRRALSGADVALLRGLARGEDAHHSAAVTPRGLPKVLASSPPRPDCA